MNAARAWPCASRAWFGRIAYQNGYSYAHDAGWAGARPCPQEPENRPDLEIVYSGVRGCYCRHDPLCRSARALSLDERYKPFHFCISGPELAATGGMLGRSDYNP